jgi:hypothetical protein
MPAVPSTPPAITRGTAVLHAVAGPAPSRMRHGRRRARQSGRRQYRDSEQTDLIQPPVQLCQGAEAEAGYAPVRAGVIPSRGRGKMHNECASAETIGLSR